MLFVLCRGDLFTTCFGPNGPSLGNTLIKITERVAILKVVLHLMYTIHSYIQTLHNPVGLFVILRYVLLEDGPFGGNHVVNISPICIIKNRWM